MPAGPTGMPTEPKGEADGGAKGASAPPAAPKLRLNGHALFVHAAPHRDLPDLPFLVDTGANVSMLPYNWYMAIPEAERPALAESPLQIMAGNQSKFNIEGVARFDICIKDMAYPCLMHVSPDETSGVLGMDFMVQHRVVVDPREQRLTINGAPMEVLDFSGKRLNSRVTATKTVHLQPKERYVVPGLIAGRRDLEERTVVVRCAFSGDASWRNGGTCNSTSAKRNCTNGSSQRH